MAQIVFPSSSAPGKDFVEGGGRLINAYAEKLQEGAPAAYAIRRAPGLTAFGDASGVSLRGLWFDGSAAVYAAYSSQLAWFDEGGTETVIGGIPDGAVAYNGLYSSPSNLSSYTLSGVAFGSEDADRRIVVGVVATEYEGSELVTNGTFGSSASWTAFNWTVSGGAARLSVASGLIFQNFSVVAGATYRIRVTAASGSGASGVDWQGNVIGYAVAGTTATFDVVATGTSGRVGLTASGTSNDVIDTISVKRVQTALPTGVTIGGVSGTAVASATRAALWVAHVPTGTTGDIDLTYAQTMNNAYVAAWRLGGVTSDTPTDTDATTTTPGAAALTVAPGGVVIALAQHEAAAAWNTVGVTQDLGAIVTSTYRISAFSGFFSAATAYTIATTAVTASIAAAVWQGTVASLGNGVVTFAKNNATTPDQVLCVSGNALVEFDTSSIGSPISVNSEVPTSVCYGDGYFFVGTTSGYSYASGINAVTFSSLDRVRMEARPGPIIRNVFWNGELYNFLESNIEVWGAGGNPNPTGFPLNRTTVIWRGLIAPLAVCGFEEGFEGGMIWVADDNSVRVLAGYDPQTISTPDVERAIERCANKSAIRCLVYDIDGHACVVIDVAGEATWVYDLTEGGKWHERQSDGLSSWLLTGNSVKAFGKWIAGSRVDGDLYQIDADAYDEAGATLPWITESIAMEAFPQRLQVPRFDANFAMGVGTDAVPEPKVKISWSDDGGHRWSDPVERSLGENGRRKMQVRVNRLGLTGVKGRRWRLRVDDPVYVSLLSASMEVEARR